MNRLERITTILLLLQTKKKTTAQQLADHFETSVRTIYRDIRVLEEAGVPVGAEAGVGYFIEEGYHLPPVLFNREEAAALLTGEKLLEKMGDHSVHAGIRSAMNKIRAVLRSSEKDFLETLEQSMAVYSSRPDQSQSFPNRFITGIQEALVKQQVIELEYFSFYNEQVNRRQVEPIGLCYISGRWHLIAYCRLRKDFRDFRSDRIKEMRLLDEHFEKRKHKSLQEYMADVKNNKDLTRIVLRFDSDAARLFGEQKFYHGLIEETNLGKETEMVFLQSSVASFAKWLLMWGKQVKIVEPPALEKEMKKLSAELTAHYK